jgi:hypothetical protein
MFRSLCIALGAAIATAAVTGAARAQDADRLADGAIRPVQAGSTAEVLKVSTITKSKVLIQEDESAGQVVDIVLSDAGCVDYVIASYDDQYYAIPFSAVSLRTADRAIFVDISPAQFRKVSFFAANQWPDFYASSYQRTVFSTFGVDTLRHEGAHRTAKPNLDRRDEARDDRQERRDDARDRRDERRDEARDRDDTRGNRGDAKDDRRNRNEEGTAGEKGTDTPPDRAPDRNANPNERRDSKGTPGPKPGTVDPPEKKPDLKGLTPKSGDKNLPKAERPKSDPPKSEPPTSDKDKSEKPRSKPIAPQPKEKTNP